MTNAMVTGTDEQHGEVDLAGRGHRSSGALEEKPPLFFLLSGLGGEQRLFQDKPDVEPIRYMEWAETVESNRDYAVQFNDVRGQIDRKIGSSPLRFVGYSVGGLLAYACAVAFEAEGRPVKSTIILDVPAIGGGSSATPIGKRLKKRLQNLASFQVRSGLASLIAKPLTRESFMPLMRRAVRYRDLRLPFEFHGFLHHKLNMQMQLPVILPWWRSVVDSAPLVKSPVFLVRSEEHEPDEPEDMGWASLCSDLKIVNVPGDHSGMLHPSNSPALSAHILRLMGLSL
jgi:thioesterase domain-containing protein